MTARELAQATAIPLPSVYRYVALLRDTGLLVGDDRGAYHLSARLTRAGLGGQAESLDHRLPLDILSWPAFG